MKYPAICINTFYFYSEISTLHLKQEHFLAAKKKKSFRISSLVLLFNLVTDFVI